MSRGHPVQASWLFACPVYILYTMFCVFGEGICCGARGVLWGYCRSVGHCYKPSASLTTSVRTVCTLSKANTQLELASASPCVWDFFGTCEPFDTFHRFITNVPNIGIYRLL